MNKNVLNEINQMKFLFGYKPGKVLSEQTSVEETYMDEETSVEETYMDEETSVEETYMDEDSDFMDFEDIEMSPSPDVAEPEVKPDVDRPDTDRPRTRPSRPDYDPAHIPTPDPETHPQGHKKDRPRRMRDLDMPRPRRMKDMSRSRMRDMDVAENIYEIEIDGDISELFK